MNKIKGIIVLALIVVMALVGLSLTFHAGEVNAANTSADNNFKTRYSTDVTITALEGSVPTGTGTSAQMIIHDGTDGEWKSISGDTTISTAGAVTIGAGAVTTGKILNDTILSEDIAIANIQASDIGAAAVNSPKLDKYTLSLLVNAGATTNSVSGDASDLYTGALLTTVGGINGINLTNDIYHDGFGNYVMSMVNAVSADAVWTLGFINAN